jgi:hypothetical protein
MLSVVRPFSIEVQGKPDDYCDVLYVQEKSNGTFVYCASDPKTQQQLFIPAEMVTRILTR